MQTEYTVYTDGSCRGNGKDGSVGGWAYVIISEGKIVWQGSGGEKATTNQRMELLAAINACQKAMELNPFAKIKLYSDSAYMINCKKQNWYKNWERNGWMNSKKQPVANPDLWKQLIGYFDNEEQFNFIKVKGHAGNEYNEIVDKLAVAAAEELKNG